MPHRPCLVILLLASCFSRLTTHSINMSPEADGIIKCRKISVNILPPKTTLVYTRREAGIQPFAVLFKRRSICFWSPVGFHMSLLDCLTSHPIEIQDIEYHTACLTECRWWLCLRRVPRTACMYFLYCRRLQMLYCGFVLCSVTNHLDSATTGIFDIKYVHTS